MRRVVLSWWCAAAVACGGRTLIDPTEIEADDAASSPVAGSSSQESAGRSPVGAVAGTPAASSGAATGGTANLGGSGGATSPDGFPITPSPDANCTPSNAKGGMACSAPCATTCGFYDMGTKACDCVSGVYVACKCPRPWNYQGRTTAPRCATPDGRTHWLDNTACVEEWAQCIGTDPVSGVNPRGCVCLTDPVNGKLEWTCGSTNRWFLPE